MINLKSSFQPKNSSSTHSICSHTLQVPENKTDFGESQIARVQSLSCLLHIRIYLYWVFLLKRLNRTPLIPEPYYINYKKTKVCKILLISFIIYYFVFVYLFLYSYVFAYIFRFFNERQNFVLKSLTHDLDTANGTSITLNVPAPHCDGIPLLQGKHFLRLITIKLITRVGVIVGHHLEYYWNIVYKF